MQDYETTQAAHVNDDGQALCDQAGDYPHMCEPDEFEMLPEECRCKRCEQLYRHCSLSNSKQHILTMISRKTPNKDDWCRIADLCRTQTKAELTSITRNLIQLELEGLVEMTTKGNEILVRLKDKGNSNNPYLLDVFNMSD